MKYHSEVALKTTTEGYLTLKTHNDSYIDKSEKFLDLFTIYRSPDGFYKLYNSSTEWNKASQHILNFYKILWELDDEEIPYKFIRIGEECEDVEYLENYTDDMPDELVHFDLSQTIYDSCEDGDYTIEKEV